VPILAPTFESTEWDVQIKELLTQITPSTEDDKIVGKLANRVRQAIRPLIPEVEVVGFASGDLSRNKAFGVAVPEVDIIANVKPSVLADRLGGRMNFTSAMKLDSRKLQKSAIRACCDRLVSVGGFKFRRSAFRGDEPKVTLLVPSSFGLSNDSIPIDFSVNAVSPLHNAALLTECGQMEPRARELILLVKRWAKDRGICHAAKGHLSPYSWALLSIFFLQAGVDDDGSLLPPVSDFKMASGLMGQKEKEPKSAWSPPANSTKTIGTLFKEFVRFYAKEFDWRKEAISVRVGQRKSPDLALSLVILENTNGTTQVAPSIEDPFDVTKNMSSGMNTASLARLHEELARADQLCSNNASLPELLEPWAPPDHEVAEQDSSDGIKDHDSEPTNTKSDPPLPPWRAQMRAH
jgi:DNA polymerase sigma